MEPIRRARAGSTTVLRRQRFQPVGQGAVALHGGAVCECDGGRPRSHVIRAPGTVGAASVRAATICTDVHGGSARPIRRTGHHLRSNASVTQFGYERAADVGARSGRPLATGRFAAVRGEGGGSSSGRAIDGGGGGRRMVLSGFCLCSGGGGVAPRILLFACGRLRPVLEHRVRRGPVVAAAGQAHALRWCVGGSAVVRAQHVC